nr:unnamed protein product [Spirometra erinaceieuropaei]
MFFPKGIGPNAGEAPQVIGPFVCSFQLTINGFICRRPECPRRTFCRDWLFYMDRMTSNELSAIASHQTFCLPKPLSLDGDVLSNFAHIATSGRNFHDLQRPEHQLNSVDHSTKNDKSISAGSHSLFSHLDTHIADSSARTFLSANGISYPISPSDLEVPKLPKKSITRSVTEEWFSPSSAALPNNRKSTGRPESAKLSQTDLKSHCLGLEPLSQTSALTSPTRHLSEPTCKVTSHSPVASEPEELLEDHRPRSCRTSPSMLSPQSARKISELLTGTVTSASAITTSSWSRLPTPKSSTDASTSLIFAEEDAGSGTSTSKRTPTNAVAAMAAAAELMMKPSLASLMSTASPPLLVQPSLRELVLKTAATTNSLPSLTTREASQGNSPNQTQQQLYLLVPSNYPVIMPCPSQLIPLSSHLSGSDETSGASGLQDASEDAGGSVSGEPSHNVVRSDSFERAAVGCKAKTPGAVSASSSPLHPLPGAAFYGTEVKQQRHSLGRNGGTTTTGQVLSNWTQTLKRKCSSAVVSPRTAQLLGCATVQSLSDVVHLSHRTSTSPTTSHGTNDSDLRPELIPIPRSPSVAYHLTDGDGDPATAAVSPSASPPVITSHNFTSCGGSGGIHGMAARSAPTSATTKKLTNLLGISQCTPVTTSAVSDGSDNFLCTTGVSRIREVLSPPTQPRSAVPTLSEVKIPPPELCHSNSTSDSLLSVDSSKNSVFFPSSESSPNRNYISRIGGDTKDIRRRVSHNEVERRRRDRINTWIAELHKLLPPEHQAKSQYQSKGVILKRVFEYFQNVAQILSSKSTTIEKLSEKNQALEQELRQLNRENQILRASLNAHFSELPNQPSSTLALSVLTPTAGSSGRLPATPAAFSKVMAQQDVLHSRICNDVNEKAAEDPVISTGCTRQSPKRLSSGNGSGVGAALPPSSTPVELPSISPSTDSPPPYKRALLFQHPSTTSATTGNPASTDVTRSCL